MSNCCDKNKGDGLTGFISEGIDRRAALKRLAAVVGSAAAVSLLPGCSTDGKDEVRLAFCSQLLCVAPYEVTRAAGFFAEEGLNVKLVYSRGGSAALQALNSGAVDYAATSFDAAINAFSHGAVIERFANTGQLPLFALATGPKTVDTVRDIFDLKGKRIGVAALGTSDHAITLALLKHNGISPSEVEIATLGPNLYDALRVGEVDAGMVQEPGLTLLLQQGGRTLVNLMDIDDANKYLGGPYAFMGVAARPQEVEKRREQMAKLARALKKGLQYTRTAPIQDVLDALPPALVAGGDFKVLSKVLETRRTSLYPTDVSIDRAACERVMQTHLLAGLQKEPVDMDKLLDTSIVTA